MGVTPELLVKTAENAIDPPQSDIPKQRMPGWIRWPIRCLFLPFILLDLASQRFVKLFIKPPWEQKGSCNQRGNCCHYILMPEPKGPLTRLFYFWNREINGFYPRYQNPITANGEKMMVMGCRYLKADGGCSQYRLRPMICREWPRIAVFGEPQVLRGCGFRPSPRGKKNEPPVSRGLNVIR